ncbi:Hypothetical_protein [Hexamita inflata]|uniref:Hypothetical_protein n=1 Tax=Hexamita inflata TaxID=28002 RepID=A0AA86PAZ6_9EUKA|nr:Hypothetical protein HINF_LOCUS22798 [Hexamita inflata]
MFGLIGLSYGILHIDALKAIYTLYNSTYYNYIGIFGFVNGSSSEFTNVVIQFFIGQQQVSQYVGALAGVLVAQIQNIHSITIQNSFITSSFNAGFIASIGSNININMVNLHDSSINCSYNVLSPSIQTICGGIIGQVRDQINLINNQIRIQIMQCIIYSIQINTYHVITWSLAGGLIGDSHITPLSIQQTIVNKSDIYAYGPVTNGVTASGLISFMYNQNNIEFSNINLCNSNLRVSSNTSQFQSCSGLFSHVLQTQFYSNMTLILSNSIVTNISLSVNGFATLSGVIFTNNRILQFSASQVSTEGTNTINGVTIQNCASVINTSQSGC